MQFNCHFKLVPVTAEHTSGAPGRAYRVHLQVCPTGGHLIKEKAYSDCQKVKSDVSKHASEHLRNNLYSTKRGGGGVEELCTDSMIPVEASLCSRCQCQIPQ